jgi:hypothetical protein
MEGLGRLRRQHRVDTLCEHRALLLSRWSRVAVVVVLVAEVVVQQQVVVSVVAEQE